MGKIWLAVSSIGMGARIDLEPACRRASSFGRCAVLFICCLCFAIAFSFPVSASEWTKQIHKDRLTGRTEISFSARGKGNLLQFGRNVSATMVLSCTNVFENREKHPDADEYSAVIQFSERVGVADASFRYRFDTNDVHHITATLSRGGDFLFASWPKAVDTTFISELKRSSKLRAEIDLPWGGHVLFEFVTFGADAALSAIPCGNNNSRTSKVVLGIRPLPVAQAVAAGLHSDAPAGLYVLQVDRGAAERAGIVKGDVVVAYDDHPVANYDDLRVLMNGTKPGATITLLVWRNGKAREMEIKYEDEDGHP